jgi:hypothetical protein
MRKIVAIAALFGLGFGALGGALAYVGWPQPNHRGPISPPNHPVWTEAQWPFPADEWGKGKAFRCTAADCGVEVNLYIRAKIGFCNCTTGVSDDEELKRLADFSLMGDKPSVLSPGRPITVGWMKGRSRPYALSAPYRAQNSALAVAFNDHCDAVVATALIDHDRPEALEPSVVAFLNSKTVIGWAEVALGL